MMNQNKEIIKKERDSNMELLRMVAMFMVLLVHADYFALGAPSVEYIQTNQADSFLRIFFEAVSIVCVNVFVLISGYYGIRPTFKGGGKFRFSMFILFCGFIYRNFNYWDQRIIFRRIGWMYIRNQIKLVY